MLSNGKTLVKRKKNRLQFGQSDDERAQYKDGGWPFYGSRHDSGACIQLMQELQIKHRRQTPLIDSVSDERLR